MICRSWKTKVICSVAVTLLLLANTNILWLQLTDDSFSGLSKCPACYGDNLCSYISAGDIQLTGADSWRLLKHLNVKNVFKGFWKSRNQSVVIKKLGYDSEMEDIDSSLLQNVRHETGNYDPASAVKILLNKTTLHDGPQQYLKLEEINKLVHSFGFSPDFLKCADQDLLNWVVESCLEHKSKPRLENILTMLLVNQEPLMAMAFPPEKQFPFPEYHGACGRLAVFSDAGQSLSQMTISSSWALRAAISWDLLQLTDSLSRTSNNLALYPTDWDPGHINVERESGIVRLVDLENIVIVNLSKVNHLPQHKSDNFGCEDCYSYSIPDLCKHSKSDHNIYSVCANILSSAPHSLDLLHDPPTDLVTKYRSFPGLLDSCWRGGLKQRLDTRYKAARNLEKILMEQIELEEDLF